MARRLEDKIEQIVGIYNSNIEIRHGFSTIPTIGPIIDSICTFSGNYFEKCRIMELIGCLSDDITRIEASKIDIQFFQSEEFNDMFKRLLFNVSRTRFHEKIQLYSKVLINSIVIENRDNRKHIEDYLILLDDLSLVDLLIINDLYKFQVKEIPKVQTPKELDFLKKVKEEYTSVCQKYKITDSDLEFALIKLSKSGLLYPLYSQDEVDFGNIYIITNIFRALVKFLKFSNEPLFNSSIIYKE